MESEDKLVMVVCEPLFVSFVVTHTRIHAIVSGLGAAFGFAALQLANDHGPPACLCPPLGAVAVLLFCLPSAPASQPKVVLGAHLIAGIVGCAVVSSGMIEGDRGRAHDNGHERVGTRPSSRGCIFLPLREQGYGLEGDLRAGTIGGGDTRGIEYGF